MGEVTLYKYDPAGNLIEKQDANGVNDAGHEHQEHDEPEEQGRDPRDSARRVEVLDQLASQPVQQVRTLPQRRKASLRTSVDKPPQIEP